MKIVDTESLRTRPLITKANQGMVFFPTYRPLEAAGQRVAQSSGGESKSERSSKKKDDDRDNPLDQDLVKALLGKGITSDVYASIQMLTEYQTKFNKTLSDTGEIDMMALQDMSFWTAKVNQMLRSAEDFKEAKTIVNTQNQLGEIAITSNGMVVQDVKNERLSVMSPVQYQKMTDAEKKQFRPLTNAELINQREFNVNLQFDETSMIQLKSSTSDLSIREDLANIVSTIQTETSKETYDYYSSPAGGDKMVKELSALMSLSAESIENISKTISIESNEKSLRHALNAMWTGLGENNRTYLRTKAALYYGKADVDETAKQMLVQLLNVKATTSPEVSYKSDLKSASAKDGSGKSKGEGSEVDDVKVGYWTIYGNDRAEKSISPFSLYDKDQQASVVIYAVSADYGPMLDGNNKPIMNQTLGEMGEFFSMNERTQVTVDGKQVISNNDLHELYYDGDDLHRITLPYTTLPSGEIVPDFDVAPKYGRQIKKIKLNNVKDVAQKTAIFKSEGLENIDPTTGEYKQVYDFQKVTVYTNKEFYKNYKSTDRSAEQLFQEVTSSNLLARYNKKMDLSRRKSEDELYKVAIYAPIKDGLHRRSFNIDGNTLKEEQQSAIEKQYQRQTGQIGLAHQSNFDLTALPKREI